MQGSPMPFYRNTFNILLTSAAKIVYSLYVKSHYTCRAIEHRLTTNDVFEIIGPYLNQGFV